MAFKLQEAIDEVHFNRDRNVISEVITETLINLPVDEEEEVLNEIFDILNSKFETSRVLNKEIENNVTDRYNDSLV